ncbi:hypothetical protein N9N00_04865 [Schleiferiaceae bacterium]|jgi:hypothetical protein|nr:hypothetical protein [Schleiferiaceae bacterium]
MKFVSTCNWFLSKKAILTGALLLSYLSFGQSPRPISLGLLNRFEQSLTQDLNSRIHGVQTIQIEAITASSGTNSKEENFVLVANAIKASCSKSVHTYSLAQSDGLNQKTLLLRAEILPSKGNDIVTFVLVKNRAGLVLFSEMYSLKGKNEERPLPILTLSSTASIHPNLEYTGLINQGLDTIRQNFSGTVFGFSLTGSQYARGRRDLTFGYQVGLMYTVPMNLNSNTPASILLSLMTGVSSELLLKEFRLFNVKSNLSWNSSILTDLTQLNLGRYNLSSGLNLYVSRNFSLRSGIELCNRSLIPWAESPLGLSNFDRFYIGIGLGF